MYWKTTTPGQLWHLVELIDGDEHVRAEVREVAYVGFPTQFVFTGHPEKYDTEAKAKAAASAVVDGTPDNEHAGEPCPTCRRPMWGYADANNEIPVCYHCGGGVVE